jgi:hypothetical protein
MHPPPTSLHPPSLRSFLALSSHLLGLSSGYRALYLYTGGTRFQSQPGYWLYWLVVFLSLSSLTSNNHPRPSSISVPSQHSWPYFHLIWRNVFFAIIKASKKTKSYWSQVVSLHVFPLTEFSIYFLPSTVIQANCSPCINLLGFTNKHAILPV